MGQYGRILERRIHLKHRPKLVLPYLQYDTKQSPVRILRNSEFDNCARAKMQSFLQNIPRPQVDTSTPKMAGYLNSVKNNIKTLLQGEVDGDREDDTIVCRALRKYYSDPSRSIPFPPWLPPDPNAPPPPVVAPVYSQPGVGSTYGVSNQGGQLKDLWGNGAGQRQDQQSLRGGPPQPSYRSQSANDVSRPGYTSRQLGPPQPQIQPRPLPSQSQQSYQNTSYGNDTPTPPGSSGGRSASDLLKDRLRNKGKPKMADVANNVIRSNSYGASATDGGGGGANYEDRFMPSGTSAYGRPSARGGDKPFMAATSPWASNEMEFGGQGYDDGGQTSRLGAGRRGPGLQSGQRGMR